MHSLISILAQEAARSTFSWDQVFESRVLVFLVGGAIAICAIVGSQLRRASATKQANRLKADMIERGFSADEIARVIAADAEPTHGRGTAKQS